ncbi:hypothetical protein PVL29_004620 [Vitis rotundifolia]|uniref:Uncharacterized protein n=1 Tax=Vitis rotundifolia TaxID=103349 RepID=A0AA39A8M7_VITRO|nr:hypothetical protein PVL29_004620 [Vitis rotundifolia]
MAGYHNALVSMIEGDKCAKVIDGVNIGGDKAVEEYLSSIGKTVDVNDHVKFGIGKA